MSRRAFLSVLLFVSLTGCVKNAPQLSARDGCVECHRPHHLERASCISCHRGDPAAHRAQLAHTKLLHGKVAEHAIENSAAVAEGRASVDTLGCRRCHTIGKTGNRLATSLDQVVWKREQSALIGSIATPVENMPKFGMTYFQIEKVVAFLLHSSDPAVAEATYRVRFAHRDAIGSAFEKQCGGCHKALLGTGPAGHGSAGPNLSGLLTLHYPPTAPGRKPWTATRLREWLRNPRAIRPGTTMRPVRLDDAEAGALVRQFTTPEIVQEAAPTEANLSDATRPRDSHRR